LYLQVSVWFVAYR